MLEAKERTEQQLEEERERRIAEGGINWPVWSWIISGSQPGDLTTGRTFSVVSDKIKVIEDPTKIGNRSDTDDESDTVDTNLIKSAFAQKIHFRLRNEPLPVAADPPVNNSETNALSELTEEMTEVGQITEEEAEITDDNHEAPEVAEIPAEETVATEEDAATEEAIVTEQNEIPTENATPAEYAAPTEAPSEDATS